VADAITKVEIRVINCTALIRSTSSA